MRRIEMSFDLPDQVVSDDRSKYQIAALDERGLRRIADGKLIISFSDPTQSIVIESEVLDYLDQLRGVLSQIDGGNRKTFTVSGDYYSNSFFYTFDPETEDVIIREVNEGSLAVCVPYNAFKQAIVSFYWQAMHDLQVLYPELQHNVAFNAVYLERI